MSDTLLRSIEEGKALTETQFASLLSLSLGPPSVASNFDASSITSSLTSEQKGAIQAMVDETGEAFEVCLRLWVEASKAETRRRLERRLAIPLGSLDNQVPTTARALLQIEKLLPLETILGLVKSRNDNADAEAASSRHVYIMAMTNRLIRDGLLTQCLQAINKNTSALQSIALSSTSRTPSMTITNPVASNSTPSDAISKEHFASRRTTTEKSLLLLAEITFFVLYSTQILPHELSELLGLLKQLSTLLAEGPVDEVAEWRVALYPVLVVLQLAHVAALNQTTTLFSRQVDAPPFFSPADKEPGNDLPQIAGDKYKLEEVWASGVSRGFCLLAHAVLRQPSTETGACPRSDVIWFLQQASSSRAYSYVRLCLLPTLQTSFFNRPDTLKFLIDVLYELFENLAHIFSMPMYQIHGGRTTEAFSFFPTSQLQHVRDATYALQSRIPTSGAYAMTGEEQQQMSLVDCLDDVMLLYGALCCARPVFANIFWSGSSFHPFVGRAVELVVVDASLISSTVRMLAGMAYGHTNNASAVFTLMRNHLPGRFDWRFVFNCINQYAQQLGNRGTATTVTTSNRQLSPKDTDALLSLMDLIAAVAGGSPLAAEALYQSDLTPVVHLFNLLSCAVAPVLKGGILHALSCLASNCCPSCTADIWTRLESYRLVPSKTSLSSSAGSNIAHQKGFKLELEAVEAAEGMYPVTDGLLSLLLALVNAGGVPSTLGLGYRFPGFLPYLDHVMNAILLKAQNRLYLPEGSEGESQKFRVIAKALKLLTLVLQKYNIHCLQPTSPSNKSSVTLKDTEIKDLLLDFVNESGEVAIEGVATRVWPKPKSAGFIIMSTLLNRSRSRLVDCLLSLLSDTIERSSLSPRVEESLAVGATAVDLLTRLRRHHSSSPQHHHAPHQGPQEYDLTNMGLERCECDGAHWREIMLTQIVTLLYECALREENFLRQIGSALEQVTLFNPEADRLECTPVLVIPLCRVLLWSPRCAPLSLLAACMNLPFFSATSSPSVPSMVIALLTHLALFDPMEDNMLTTVDDLPSFLTSCINALVRPEQLSLAVEDVQEGAMGVILASRGYDVPATSLPLQHCVNTQTPAPLPEEEPANTLRCRVLVYLLTTLSASKLSVAHYLLGLYALILEEIMSQTTIPTSMKAHDPLTKSTSLRSPIPNAPISCLDAILDLLLFSNNGQNNSFLSSKDCALCMELLYRVCVDSRTSLAMLGLLRKRSVSAVPRLLRAFATRLSFVGNNLERGNGDAHFFMHSIAWLLKICTMDIQVTRTLLCFARNNETTLLEMLLFPSSEEQQDQQSEGLLLHMINKCATMCSPLLTIVNLSSISSLLMRVSDPISVSVSIAQGVERACGDDDSNNPPMCSHYNIPSLRRILTSSSSAVSSGGGVEGNIDLITSQTLELNRYGAQTAAITHLAQAVKQLIEVCVDHEESSVLLSPLNHDTLQSIELSLERWIQYVLTPLLNMILKQLHFEMSFLEPLLRALFATLTLIRDLMEISNKNVSSSSSFLSLPLNDYEDLLKGLLRALLRRGCDVAIPASSLYTSHLLSCFMVTLQLGSFSHGDGYSNVTLAALEPRTVELTELLCRQMEDTVSLPSLLLLLQALRGSHSEYPFSNQREAQLVGGFISPALIQCLDVLQNKGFLSKLVHSLEKESIGNSGPALEMTLSLFTELTLLANGTQLLQETQLLHVLLARKDVEAELVGERSLLQILRLFSSLLYSSASGDLISGVVKYVNQNRQLLRLLRLREGSSWLRLQLTDAFVSLLLAVAARTLSMRPSRKEKEQTSSFLGPITDMIITYLCNLLGFIGATPLPSSSSSYETTWMNMIQAEVDKSHIAALGRSILRTSASFLRIVCNHAIEGQDPFGGALCIDLNIIAQVFVRISGLLPPSVTSSPSNYSSSSAPDYQWLATSQALVSFAPQASMEPMLIEEFEEICCHLVCIIHDIVLLSTDEERESNCRQTLSKMLAAAEKWTPHSFVRTVASKIADLLV